MTSVLHFKFQLSFLLCHYYFEVSRLPKSDQLQPLTT